MASILDGEIKNTYNQITLHGLTLIQVGEQLRSRPANVVFVGILKEMILQRVYQTITVLLSTPHEASYFADVYSHLNDPKLFFVQTIKRHLSGAITSIEYESQCPSDMRTFKTTVYFKDGRNQHSLRSHDTEVLLIPRIDSLGKRQMYNGVALLAQGTKLIVGTVNLENSRHEWVRNARSSPTMFQIL